MRKLSNKIPELNIIHRSFALVKEEGAFDTMYGSRENAKKEILNHWEHANLFDELKRFNIDGMAKENFPFPSSMKPLKAAKAGGVIGGDKLYWDIFDNLQKGLFMESKNIGDDEIIFNIVKSMDIDFLEWSKIYQGKEIEKLVEKDLEIVSNYGIMSVPTLVINEKYMIEGFRTSEELVEIIKGIKPE